jgi:hypothetical protein
MLKRKKAGEWVQEEGTHFVAVDLDVFSRRRLSALAEALGDRVVALYEGRWGSRYSAHFELHGWNQTADQQIRGLVSLIRKLPRPAELLWNEAQLRVFNIGVQAGLNPHSHEVKLSPATVAQAAQIRAGLVITTYAPDASSSVASATPSSVRAPQQAAAPGGGRERSNNRKVRDGRRG